MAIDQRPDVFLPGPPPVMDDAPDARPAHAAPLRPMDRAWLLTWRTQLDPRLHAGVPATTMVSHLVRGQSEPPAPPSTGFRYLARADTLHIDPPALAPHRPSVLAPSLEPGPAERPMPRSMGVQPVLAYGLSRRTAELLAVLSSCLDPAERRPDGHAVRVAYLASRLAAELEMGDDMRSDLLYAGLLRDAGSTGLEAADHEPATADRSRRGLGLARRPATPRPSPTTTAAPHLSRPDRAAAMVRVLGLPQGVLEAVASAEERWDGKGPRHEKRTAVPSGAKIWPMYCMKAKSVPISTAPAST